LYVLACDVLKAVLNLRIDKHLDFLKGKNMLTQ